MASPNLFDFATKELSQDAVICWLIAWADTHATERPVDGGLRECGRAFVDALFATWEGDWGKVELGSPIRTKVQRQENRIDVLARVDARDARYVLLIEDKTDTGAHDDQLDRYRTTVLNGETEFGVVANEDLFPIYVKTGNHSLKDRQYAEAHDYAVFDRTDFLRVLDAYDGPNPILLDFRDHLRRWQRETDSFRSWTERTIAYRDDEGGPSALGWEGFYRCIEEDFLVHTDDYWAPLTTQVGSFWGIGIEPPEWKSESSNFALWIEKNRISFRLYGATDGTCSVDGMNREKAYWANAFTESSDGWLTKPSRFAATKKKPMCVVEWQGWLAFGNDGRLDMDETANNLNWAKEILRSTIEEAT